MKRRGIHILICCAAVLILAACVTRPVPEPPPTTEAPRATATPTPTVLPTSPASTATPIPTPFSLVVFPDTQVYTYKSNNVFEVMTQWAADTKEQYNTLAVLHVGDIVEERTDPLHWEKAAHAISLLKGHLPFYPVAGNHDVGWPRTVHYERYLAQDFCDARDPELLYKGGACWAQPLHAGGTDFLLLGIGWQVDADYIPWAREILAAWPDRVVILVTHSFLTKGGRLTEEGQLMERELLRDFPSVRLVLCGHAKGAKRWAQTHEDGSQTHALLFNVQKENARGLYRGYLRLLTFDPITRTLTVVTYSPFSDSYLRSDKNEFVIENAF
ncbi:MAG: metallophosphoesterase [Clostridiales bacterium]|nr:metallophosphoesterase [Clostridiales bacterium]